MLLPSTCIPIVKMDINSNKVCLAEGLRSNNVLVQSLNAHITCSLCGGYFIDATTILECVHTFCRSCIVSLLEVSEYCPVCDVRVHDTKPLLGIRRDKTIQDLVYKMVPGLYTRELERRDKFYSRNPRHFALDSMDKTEVGCADIIMDDEKISVALEFREMRVSDKRKKKAADTVNRRYLLCPSKLTIRLVKKFIRAKFDIDSRYQVEIYHTDEPLEDRYTLMDLAYIYSWQKTAPFKLFFSAYELLQTDPVTEVSQSAEPVPSCSTHQPGVSSYKTASEDSDTESDSNDATYSPFTRQNSDDIYKTRRPRGRPYKRRGLSRLMASQRGWDFHILHSEQKRNRQPTGRPRGRPRKNNSLTRDTFTFMSTARYRNVKRSRGRPRKYFSPHSFSTPIKQHNTSLKHDKYKPITSQDKNSSNGDTPSVSIPIKDLDTGDTHPVEIKQEVIDLSNDSDDNNYDSNTQLSQPATSTYDSQSSISRATNSNDQSTGSRTTNIDHNDQSSGSWTTNLSQKESKGSGTTKQQFRSSHKNQSSVKHCSQLGPKSKTSKKGSKQSSHFLSENKCCKEPSRDKSKSTVSTGNTLSQLLASDDSQKSSNKTIHSNVNKRTSDQKESLSSTHRYKSAKREENRSVKCRKTKPKISSPVEPITRVDNRSIGRVHWIYRKRKMPIPSIPVSFRLEDTQLSRPSSTASTSCSVASHVTSQGYETDITDNYNASPNKKMLLDAIPENTTVMHSNNHCDKSGELGLNREGNQYSIRQIGNYSAVDSGLGNSRQQSANMYVPTMQSCNTYTQPNQLQFSCSSNSQTYSSCDQSNNTSSTLLTQNQFTHVQNNSETNGKNYATLQNQFKNVQNVSELNRKQYVTLQKQNSIERNGKQYATLQNQFTNVQNTGEMNGKKYTTLQNVDRSMFDPPSKRQINHGSSEFSSQQQQPSNSLPPLESHNVPGYDSFMKQTSKHRLLYLLKRCTEKPSHTWHENVMAQQQQRKLTSKSPEWPGDVMADTCDWHESIMMSQRRSKEGDSVEEEDSVEEKVASPLLERFQPLNITLN